jgi:hypothetical protein
VMDIVWTQFIGGNKHVVSTGYHKIDPQMERSPSPSSSSIGSGP